MIWLPNPSYLSIICVDFGFFLQVHTLNHWVCLITGQTSGHGDFPAAEQGRQGSWMTDGVGFQTTKMGVGQNLLLSILMG
jgi:hypothetical protein